MWQNYNDYYLPPNFYIDTLQLGYNKKQKKVNLLFKIVNMLNPFERISKKKSQLYKSKNYQQFYQKLLVQFQTRIKNPQNEISSLQPDCIIQYLQDWFKKLIKDGHEIQKILQIMYQNSYQYPNTNWLQKFLVSSKNHLKKRSLKPRICLPHMYIQKDQNQIKSILKQTYPFLDNNDKILNLLMRNSYNWVQQDWDQIYKEICRNRYQCKKICFRNRNEHDQTIGVLFRNSKMKDNQGLYGECVYVVHYNSVVNQVKNHKNDSQNKQQIQFEVMRHVLLGIIYTQFQLPLIIFVSIYDTKRIKSQTIFNNTQKLINNQIQNKLDNEIIHKNDDAQYEPAISTVDYYVVNTIIQWSTHKPIHIVYLFKQNYQSININQNQYFKFNYHNYHSTNIQITKQNATTITSASITFLSKQQSTSQVILPFIYTGLYLPQQKDPLTQIFTNLTKTLTNNNQYPIQLIIQRITSRCYLITSLLKLINILHQQSLMKREAATQIIQNYDKFFISNKNNISNSIKNSKDIFTQEDDQYLYEQIKMLKANIYAKATVEIMIDIIKKSNKIQLLNFPINDCNATKIVNYLTDPSQKGQKYEVIYKIQQQLWKCSCMYLYRTGIPCAHIVKILRKYNGNIIYYINDRWKNPKPIVKPNNKPNPANMANTKSINEIIKQITLKKQRRQYMGCPVTNNKGLIRLVNLFRTINYGYLF